MKNDEVSDARDRSHCLDAAMRQVEQADGSREEALEAGLLALVYENRDLFCEVKREGSRPIRERIRREMMRQVEAATEAGDASKARGFLAAIRALDAMTSEADG